MDYKSAWNELKSKVDTESKTFCKDCSLDYAYGLNHMARRILEAMNAIEPKSQPKQYTWSEVLSMSPLPKKIRSCMTDLIYYNGIGGINDSKERFYQLLDKSSHKMGQPCVNEMKNNWTIIE